jgi:trigger factor
MHGPALEQEALNTAVQEGVQKLLADEKLRPAMQPAVELEEGGPGKDAVIRVELETLPDLPAPQIDDIALERLTVEPTDAEVDAAVNRMVEGQKSYDPAPEGHAAAMGDLVVIDYLGTVDGTAFEGGTGEDMRVELGSGRLIPGFEDQLVGATVGEQRTLSVSFPDEYPVETLKGQPAEFAVTVKEVQTAREANADDAFAKSMGLEGIDQLRELLKGQIEQELNGLTRTHMKRKLLDRLAETHSFEVPPSMVEAEFNQIWEQLEHEAGHDADPEAARAEMETEREEYRTIAERRVRLGLLLSEIGTRNNIQIAQNEMNQLIMQAAQQYRPEDRQKFMEYIQNEPMAAAQLRAPLFEDKVVDFLFDKATITDRTVTRDALQAEIESTETDSHGHVHGPDCNHDHDHDHGGEAKPKKAKKAKAADAAPAEDASDAAPATDEKPKKAKKAKAADAAPAEETAEAAPAGEDKPKKARAKKKAD